MRKILYIIVALTLSVMSTSCLDSIKQFKDKVMGSSETENPDSKAANSKWDFYLIGSWLYTQEESELSYSKGVETFHGNGEYINHTEDAKGNRNVLTGTWRVDNEEDYTIDITIESIKTPEGEQKVDKKMKYTIIALEPEAMLSYEVDGKVRTAACLEE